MSIDSLAHNISATVNQSFHEFNRLVDSLRSDTRLVAQTVGEVVSAVDNGVVAARENTARILGAVSDVGNQIKQATETLGLDLQQIGNMLDQRLALVSDQLRVQNLLTQNVAELLRVPDFQKERQFYIEQGFKHYHNARIDPSLFADALQNLLQAEARDGSDYVVLHRIGMIYLYSEEQANPENAEIYFRKAAKYAAVESNPDAQRIANVLSANVTGSLTRPQSSNQVRYLAADSHLQGSLACFAQGKLTDAIEMAQKAIELKPDFIEAQFHQARALAFNRQGDQAANVLEPMLSRLPLRTCFESRKVHHFDRLPSVCMRFDSSLFYGQEAIQAELQETTALPDRSERQEMGCSERFDSGEGGHRAASRSEHAQIA